MEPKRVCDDCHESLSGIKWENFDEVAGKNLSFSLSLFSSSISFSLSLFLSFSFFFPSSYESGLPLFFS